LIIMKTNLRERLTRYQCFIRPKVHFALEFSFKMIVAHLVRCILQFQYFLVYFNFDKVQPYFQNIFYSHVVSNLYDVLSSAEHKINVAFLLIQCVKCCVDKIS